MKLHYVLENEATFGGLEVGQAGDVVSNDNKALNHHKSRFMEGKSMEFQRKARKPVRSLFLTGKID